MLEILLVPVCNHTHPHPPAPPCPPQAPLTPPLPAPVTGLSPRAEGCWSRGRGQRRRRSAGGNSRSSGRRSCSGWCQNGPRPTTPTWLCPRPTRANSENSGSLRRAGPRQEVAFCQVVGASVTLPSVQETRAAAQEGVPAGDQRDAAQGEGEAAAAGAGRTGERPADPPALSHTPTRRQHRVSLLVGFLRSKG